MRASQYLRAFQWLQLSTLSFAHFYVDMCVGMLPAILPVIRKEFDISLGKGIALLSVCYFVCNLVQVLVGHLRAKKKRPLLLTIGIILSSAICLCGLIPHGKLAFPILFILVVITAAGVAILHPEGLRAVHLLRRISPATGTAFFLNGGVLGFCVGAFLAAGLVYLLGLKGLLVFLILPVIGVFLTISLRIRLAVERERSYIKSPKETAQIPFWILFIIVVPFVTSGLLIPALLPTRLNELGFKLYFGAMPVMLWGIGNVIGSFFWAAVANRKGQLKTSIISSLLVVPPLILYLATIEFRFSIWLLLPTGFGAFAAFSLIVAMARNSKGGNLGGRMGLIVGGVWGVASLVLMALGPVAEKYGVAIILNLSWSGYFLTALIGFIVFRTRGYQKPSFP